MAVQPQTPYKEYTANGSTNSFALEFDCDNQDHLIVLVDGMEPVVGTWSLSGGSVVFGTTPASGKKITIQRNTPFRRDEDFQSYDNSFRPPGVNKGFDKIWLKLQELGVADWILGARIDALKNYVDRKDDELKAYLVEEIRKQGVALDQLDEYYNYLMQRLAQIAVDKGWDASFVTDESGLNQQQINNFVRNLVLTPEYFGATADEGDSSAALQNAINFCSVNNAVLDGRGKTYNGNSIVIEDNTYIKRIKINSNKFDETNSILTTDYGMLTPLKNITLDDVELDGKREMHTNVASEQDGGRCCFLIRRPIDGLTIRNSKLNNAVTDGLMLFPVDWAITAENWTHFVKNVTIENSEMFWNGRWGISTDSSKHMTLRNVRGKFNGLDVSGGGSYTTGKSARLHGGKYYGGGFDLEEYHGFAYSKDINIINCDMTENASNGLLFERTGELSGTTEIAITGGNFDKGTSSDSSGRSISFSAYSDTGSITAYKAAISQPNLNGGDLYLRKCQNADVSQLMNLNTIHIDQSVVIADKIYPHIHNNSSNSNFQCGIRDGKDDFLGTNNTESTVWLHTENKIEAVSSIKVRAGGMNLGGIRFQKAQGAGSAGLAIEFMNGEDPVLGVTQYGTIYPAVTLDVSLGTQGRRFQKAWLGSANMTELAVFGNNSAAISGGLVAGDFYRTSTGQVMVVY